MERLNFIWNVPNTLSLVRLLLLPIFAIVYLNGDLYWSMGVLALSGLTDLLDGFIARRYNQITEIGKLLDPIADKLTQIIVLVCLTIRNPSLIPLFVICLFKELLQAIGGWILLSRNEIIRGSNWYGKVSTFTFYVAMLLIAVWTTMPNWLLKLLIVLVAVTMLFAFAMYLFVYFKLRRDKAAQQNSKDATA